MQRVSFALTALDAHVAPPSPGFDDPVVAQWAAPPLERVPVIRLFGITLQGASVCAHVHGFRPFFYAELSEEVARSLVRNPAPDAAEEPELRAPAELAVALEAAAAWGGRHGARVAGLQLHRT